GDSAMTPSSNEILARLGAGESIASIRAAAGWSKEKFDAWWHVECERRLPATQGRIRMRGIRDRVQIGRDQWGIPTIEAESDADLFFGFGYAAAQDRLFQLDYLRRKARG